MMFVSYAQNFEDVMLWRALGDVENGFYVDIGAHDPVVDSVSRAAYENGWRGVHVEPTSFYATKLREDRPDEDVLECAIGAGSGTLLLFEFPETGLSTGDPKIAQQHKSLGYQCSETTVRMVPLETLLDRYIDRDIHWLKIDVEGMEGDVLASWGKSKSRPWIVVVEATIPLKKERIDANWQRHLTDRDYELSYFDGLNSFYVHSAHADRKAAFQAPPNVFDEFAIAGTASSNLASIVNHKLREAEETILKLRHNEAGMNTVILRTQTQLAEAQAQLAEAQAQLAEARKTLNAIYNSRLWSVTSTFRQAAHRLQRLLRTKPADD